MPHVLQNLSELQTTFHSANLSEHADADRSTLTYDEFVDWLAGIEARTKQLDLPSEDSNQL